MILSPWFGFALLFIVILTLVMCVIILFYTLRLARADTTVTESMVKLIDQISTNMDVSHQQMLVKHEHMTSILVSVSDELLRMRQDRVKYPCKD